MTVSGRRTPHDLKGGKIREEPRLLSVPRRFYPSSSPLSLSHKLRCRCVHGINLTRMPVYSIRGINVDFPFEAYPSQITYMDRVIESLQNVPFPPLFIHLLVLFFLF